MDKTALLLIFLAGCSTLNHSGPEDWPDLKIVEHWVSNAEFKDRCDGIAPWWASIEACASFDFRKKECHLVFSRDFPPHQYVLDYERNGRCKGKDNPGSTLVMDQWEAYKLGTRDEKLWAEFHRNKKDW
jgi:hypothetical protein